MRKATGVEPAVKEAVTKAVEKQSEAVETNRAKRADVIKDNLETQRGALNEIERKKIAAREKAEQENTAQSAEHEAKTSKAASDHAAEVKRIQEENQGAEQTLALRRQTETALKQKTDAYFAKEDQVKAKAKAADDENWTAWRDKVGDAEVDMQPVRNTIERVSANFPEVRQILKDTAPSEEDLSVATEQFVLDRQSFMKHTDTARTTIVSVLSVKPKSMR